MDQILGILTGLVAVILIFGALPALIVLIYYFNRKAKHKERMALIEKGIDASIYMKEEATFHKVLLWGMLMSGIGLGLLIGYLLSVFTRLPDEIIPITAVLFGGFGLIGYYVYRKKTETKSAD
jgi:uncharacterized membrane protein YesL